MPSIIIIGSGPAGVSAALYAVRAGVVEYAFEHDADAALPCGFAERFKILFPAEQRIDAGVVRRVVPVVACRLKDRVQVQNRDRSKVCPDILPAYS